MRLQRVLTDNAKAYTDAVVFTDTAAGLGIRLKHPRPYRPQTNGKVERYNRTALNEWAYAGCTVPILTGAGRWVVS